MMNREQMIADIAREVIARLQLNLPAPGNGHPGQAQTQAPAVCGDGVFPTVNDAVSAAFEAQKRVAAMSLEERGRMVAVIRRICEERSQELARMELDETHLGRLDHKIEKLKAVRHVLGVEAMRTEARSDASGLCVMENAPFGVIGMVLPATHPVPTMAGNAINILAAGNTAVFSPHPVGARTAAHALRIFNSEIRREIGIENVITTVSEPSIKTAEEIFHHPAIRLICATGGPALVRAAAKIGRAHV